MPNALNSALAQAQTDADAAGVRVALIDGNAGYGDVRQVFDAVWGDYDGTQVQPDVLRAITFAGGYACVAYAGDAAVGSCFGVVGRSQVNGHWHDHLHSHSAAVLEQYRNRSVGKAMKSHQRAWALSQGLDSIQWTFDPLMRRNARLNLLKLGAQAIAYEVNMYGALGDLVNLDDPTDRLLLNWDLPSDRATTALSDGLEPLSASDFPGATLVEAPDDIAALRASDPAAAHDARLRMREQMLDAFGSGLTMQGVTENGTYVFTNHSA
jgi:predicted GNAT superfamily acetyltransferase